MVRSIRWGILGTGTIAKKFAADLRTLPDAELAAVGSRASGTAGEFARLFGITTYHSSYQDLAADPRVDVVYIATPHVFHFENTLLCLENGKSVLCEKPFCLNSHQAAKIIACARKRKLFLMEAMWTRFLPAIVQLRHYVDEGIIGEIKLISANLGFKTDFGPEHRLMSLNLGGGALLDIGVYPISLITMLIGQPDSIESKVQFSATGVDEQGTLLFKYTNNVLAAVHMSIRVQTSNDMVLVGTGGEIRVCAPLYRPEKLIIQRQGQSPRVVNTPCLGGGYNYQAQEVMRCIKEGITESPIMPLTETLRIMQTMDRIRAHYGLRYPGEADEAHKFN